MQRDEIIEMARQACALTVFRMPNEHKLIGNAALEAFAKLVAAKEREAVEERVVDLFTDMETPYLPDIVKAIRARGES